MRKRHLQIKINASESERSNFIAVYKQFGTTGTELFHQLINLIIDGKIVMIDNKLEIVLPSKISELLDDLLQEFTQYDLFVKSIDNKKINIEKLITNNQQLINKSKAIMIYNTQCTLAGKISTILDIDEMERIITKYED